MKNMKYMLFVLTIVSSLAFGQFEKGTTLMDGDIRILSVDGGEDYDGNELDNITATSLSLTYGQFLIDNLLVSGSLSYLSISGSDASTDIGIGVDYFFSGSWYAGLGMLIPDGDVDSELILGAGMLVPFKESSNVHLHPSLIYFMDSEVLSLGVGLTLLF